MADPGETLCQADGDGDEQPILSGCTNGLSNRIANAQMLAIAEGTSNSVLDMYLGYGAGGTTPAANSDFGVFSDARLSHTEHDGYRVTVKDPALGPVADSFTPDFQSDQFSVIGSLQGDVSHNFGFKETVVRLGVFGGYASNKVNIDADPANLAPKTSSFNQSGVGGLYVLMAQGPYYGLLTASGIIGNTSVDDYDTQLNQRFTGDYDTFGAVVNGTAGRTFQLDPRLALDIRAALSLAGFKGDEYVNSLGNRVDEVAHLTLAGNISAGLIGNLDAGGMVLRPYMRAGVTHRLYDENRADETVLFKSNDDTSLTGNIGLYVAVSQSVELNAEVSGTVSEDANTIAGKLAVKVQLN